LPPRRRARRPLQRAERPRAPPLLQIAVLEELLGEGAGEAMQKAAAEKKASSTKAMQFM
jgi:hypothetical protein